MTTPDDRTISYIYSPTGQRAAMFAPGSGVFTYTYDDAERPGLWRARRRHSFPRSSPYCAALRNSTRSANS
jgi:hypothetical protein